MTRHSLNWLLLALTLVLCTAMANVAQAQATKVYVDPVESIADPSESFTINVNVADVVDLFSWTVSLKWNPSILSCTNVEEGPFLKNVWPTHFQTEIHADYIRTACSLMVAVPGVSGSGTLMKVTFLVLDAGSSVLDIYDSLLLATFGELIEIPHTVEDGYFHTPLAKVYVDPEESVVSIGESFTINVNVADVVDLYSWAMELRWEPNILECTNVQEGAFLQSQPGGSHFVSDIYLDHIVAGCSTLGVSPGVDGSGTLMKVTFLVLDAGNSVLDLYHLTLLDSALDEISYTVEDGYFHTPLAVPEFNLNIGLAIALLIMIFYRCARVYTTTKVF